MMSFNFMYYRTASINHEADPTSAVNNEEVIKLEDRLKQRDEEISMMSFLMMS